MYFSEEPLFLLIYFGNYFFKDLKNESELMDTKTNNCIFNESFTFEICLQVQVWPS